ncbi:MAG TPA: cytochrome d ubiquinol oxidase subunit II [Spirochaetia bacterium]|nr:cytochrome d ubiquinol oxidase subunit II [Spirochaetia bacterium]
MALQVLWFILWGLLWAVYFVVDGFDFGTGMLRPFLAKTETERKISLESIGPVWNGNEVWLITAGGATFAAFPRTYAYMFSFLYLPMLLILFSLILRGVSIEFRNKDDGARWRTAWDRLLALTSFTAPLVLGLGFGNIFQGLAFDSTGYHGGFWPLFNIYGLLTAVLFVVLFLQHGALWMGWKTEGEVAARADKTASVLWFVVLVVAAVFLVLTGVFTKLYGNYLAHPGLFVVPLLAVIALVLVKVLHAGSKPLAAFLASAGTILLVVATGLVGLFPNLIPSATDPASSLTIMNSSSSQYTLRLMAIVALIFVPIVVVYQLLVYRFFRARTTAADVEEGGGY